MEQPDDVLVREVRIAARPDIVFAYFTDPERMRRWKGVSADLDPKPGGIFEVHLDATHVARGEYVAVEPFHRVVFTFGWVGDDAVPPGSTTVEVTLRPDGDGTLLRLCHSGLLTRESVAGHAAGWDHFLPRLVVAAAGGDPGPDTHTDLTPPAQPAASS